MNCFPNVLDIHLLPKPSMFLFACELTSHTRQTHASLPVLSIRPLLLSDPHRNLRSLLYFSDVCFSPLLTFLLFLKVPCGLNFF